MILDKYDLDYLDQIRLEIIEKRYGKIKISQLPGLDYSKVRISPPDLRMEHQWRTLTEIEVLRRERKARRLERRAQRPWWLRWY